MNGSEGEQEKVGPSKDQLSHCLMGSPAESEDYAVLIGCPALTGPRGCKREEVT